MAKQVFEMSDAAFQKSGDDIMSSSFSEHSIGSYSDFRFHSPTTAGKMTSKMNSTLQRKLTVQSQVNPSKSGTSESSMRLEEIEKARQEAIEEERVSLKKQAEAEVLLVARRWNTFWSFAILIIVLAKTKEVSILMGPEELGGYILLCLTYGCLVVSTIASYKRTLAFASPGPYFVQCILFSGEVLISGETQSIKELNLQLEVGRVASKVTRAYFLFFMQLINSIIIWQVSRLECFKRVFCLFTLVTSFGLLQFTQHQLGLYNDFQVIVQISMIMLIASATMILSMQATHKLTELTISSLLKSKAESNQFKRIVDSIKEAILVVQKGEVHFRNATASSLSNLDDISTSRKMFFLYSDAVDPKARSSGKGTLPHNYFLKGQGYSMNDLMKRKRFVQREQFVFTFKPAIAACSNMNQVQDALDKDKSGEDRDEDCPQFRFFLVNIIQIEQAYGQVEKEIVFQLTDISQKIMYDHLSVERKYMTYLNSTISHEMRNPLNSISAQTQVMKELLLKFQALMSSDQEVTALNKEFVESLEICEASCKLLAFNVEDILALPQLKEGKFTKNIQAINPIQATEEVMRIQKYQATTKGIDLQLLTHGFSERFARVQLDEKRFQQAVLNYQSNALKFINRQDGRVLVHLAVIPPEIELYNNEPLLSEVKRLSDQFYGFNIFEKPSPEVDSESSEIEEQDPYRIFEADIHPKLVLTILDNGVGIKEEDQSKLFKLFGCLKATRQMNTQGIGLGLVITKMITEEFGGQTQMFSKFKYGSVFQSSFLLRPKERKDSVPIGVDSLPEFLKRKSTMKGESMIDYRQRITSAKAVQLQKCVANLPQLLSTKQLQLPQAFNEKRILIIDDEAFNVKALQAMIKALKFKHAETRVDVAYSGEEALALVHQSIRPTELSSAPGSSRSRKTMNTIRRMSVSRAEPQMSSQDNANSISAKFYRRVRKEQNLESAYGLILTDCSMPFMDGYECALHIHNILEANGISEAKPSIIAITGHVESEYQRKAVLSGMDMVYGKPLKSETLWMILAEHNFEVGVTEAQEKMVKELS